MVNALFSALIKEKQLNNIDLRKKYKFQNQYKNIWLIKINNESKVKKLINWLAVLPANFIVISDLENINLSNVLVTKTSFVPNSWFDFIVCDDESNCKINTLFKKWIIPVINKNSPINSILMEFNPMANEWNSFLYSENNEWSIFYALVRCLENLKFPQDKKNLIKNVFDIN